MRIGVLLAGLVFLFNPNVNMIDILPDAVGWGLILYGILPISRCQTNFSEAAKWVKRLFLLSLIKIPAFFVCYVMDSEAQLLLLIGSLVFSCLEAVFGLFFAKDFYDGFGMTADRERDALVFDGLKNARRCTAVFFPVKAILCVLPDLTLLANDEYGVVGPNGIESLKRYRGVFTVFGVLAVLIVGIVWLVLVLRHGNRVKGQTAYLAGLNRQAELYYADNRRVAFQTLISGLTFLLAGGWFLLELKIEGYSLVPPMIGAALFCLFFFLSKKEMGKNARRGFIASVVWLILSTFAWGLSVAFARRHYDGVEDSGLGFAEVIRVLVDRDFDILDELLLITGITVAASLAFFTALVFLYRLLPSLIDGFTGLPDSRMEEKDKSETVRAHEEAEKAAIRNGLFRGRKPLLILGGLTALCAGVYPLVQVYFYHLFAIDLVIRIVFVAFFVGYTDRMRKAVKVRGGLDFDG